MGMDWCKVEALIAKYRRDDQKVDSNALMKVFGNLRDTD